MVSGGKEGTTHTKRRGHDYEHAIARGTGAAGGTAWEAIMAHHKKKRPKNRRSGCLMCKYWKVNGYKKRGKVNCQSGKMKQEWRGWKNEQEQRDSK